MSPETFYEALVFVGLMALLGVTARVVLTILRRPRAGGPDATTRQQLDEIVERLGRLEQAADATALEVERIGEAHRFTVKLLAERPAADSSATRPT